MLAELLILAVSFGPAPPPPVTVTPVGLPPGVEIEVAFPERQEPWPAEWICVNEEADQPGTIVQACGDAEQIRADYPPPYFTHDGRLVVFPGDEADWRVAEAG